MNAAFEYLKGKLSIENSSIVTEFLKRSYKILPVEATAAFGVAAYSLNEDRYLPLLIIAIALAVGSLFWMWKVKNAKYISQFFVGTVLLILAFVACSQQFIAYYLSTVMEQYSWSDTVRSTEFEVWIIAIFALIQLIFPMTYNQLSEQLEDTDGEVL